MKPGPLLWLAPALTLVAAPACGDGRATPPDAAAPASDGGAPDAPMFVDPGDYDDPADFDHFDCDTTAPLDQVDLLGIWHLDYSFDFYGSFPGAMRFDQGKDAYFALIGGERTLDVRVSPTDVFTRVTALGDNGSPRTRSYDSCAVLADGSLYGKYARCQDGDCVLGTYTAHKVEPLDEPPAAGVRLVGEYNGPAAAPWPTDSVSGLDITVNVRQHEGVAYVARYRDGLRIVDVSDPAAPVELGHAPVTYPGEEIYNDVKVVEAGARTYALMASDMRGIVVIDVTDPGQPIEAAAFPPSFGPNEAVNVHTLFIEGTRAYLADISRSGLDIYDIADPTQPVQLGSFEAPEVATQGGFVHDLYVENGRAYLDYWNLGLVVVDTAADPAHPALVGGFDDYDRRTSHSNWVAHAGGRTVTVHGDEDYGAHVRIIDVDPASSSFMTAIASYQTRPEVSVHNIMAVGSLALVTYYQDGLRLLDLSDPTAPVEVGHYQTWPGPAPGYGGIFYEAAIGVDYDPAGDLVYLADTHRGLLILALEVDH